MDELAKREAIEDGIDEERLIITGQPYFETVLENWKNVNSKDVIKAKQNIAHDRFVILFVSEPLSKVYKQANHLDHFYGFTEISIFTELITALENVLDKLHQKPIIIIRNHPKEDPESFKIFLKKYKELITVDNVSNAFELVKIADLVIGMSSMLLIESAILGKSIESVQIGMKRKDNFVLNRLGITSPITNRKCLESKLVSYVNNLDAKKLKFSFINSASANIVNEVKKIYEKTRN
jgi:UDP-N-acetylglucosamine 2-epimerase